MATLSELAAALCQEHDAQDRARLRQEEPGYWSWRWPRPLRLAVSPLGFAFGTLTWALTGLGDRLLPGTAESWEYWYGVRTRRAYRKQRGQRLAQDSDDGEEG